MCGYERIFDLDSAGSYRSPNMWLGCALDQPGGEGTVSI